MSYIVAAAQAYGPNTYTITSVIQLMSGANPPAQIAFQTLGGGGTSLITGQGAAINMGVAPNILRSVGLISCASVCFVNGNNGHGYVYHANVGAVPQVAFNTAMAAIGAPPFASVYIAIAHPGPTGGNYQTSITNFVLWGVPTNNIVEITDTYLAMFGLNNVFQIGY